MALTRRQKQVLDLIAKFVDENGYSPSYEELAQGLNLASLATVHKHISALTTKNYLKRGFNQSRSLELGPKYVQENRRHRDAAALEIPLLGRIAAGLPVESVEQRATLSFADFVGPPGHLRARSARRVHDRRSHLRRRHGPARARGRSARRRNRGRAGGRQPRQPSNAFIANREARFGCSPPTPPCSRSSFRPRTCRYRGAF